MQYNAFQLDFPSINLELVYPAWYCVQFLIRNRIVAWGVGEVMSGWPGSEGKSVAPDNVFSQSSSWLVREFKWRTSDINSAGSDCKASPERRMA